MIISFQMTLLIVIVFSFFGVGDRKNSEDTREKMFTMFLASLLAFIMSVLWL